MILGNFFCFLHIKFTTIAFENSICIHIANVFIKFLLLQSESIKSKNSRRYVFINGHIKVLGKVFAI